MNKLISWLFSTKKENKYLTQKDIVKLGFKETKQQGHLQYFKKGNMSLKWDFHITKRIITIKWGKSLRHFGIVETNKELKKIINNIDIYFNKRK